MGRNCAHTEKQHAKIERKFRELADHTLNGAKNDTPLVKKQSDFPKFIKH